MELSELVAKWRDGIAGMNKFTYPNTTRAMKLCADELEAALAAQPTSGLAGAPNEIDWYAQIKNLVASEMQMVLADGQMRMHVERVMYAIEKYVEKTSAAQPSEREKALLGKVLGTIHNRFNDRESHTGAWDEQRIVVAEVIQAFLAAQPEQSKETNEA